MTAPSSPSDCFICRKHRGEIAIPGGAIVDNDLLYVGHAGKPDDPSPVYLGWLVVETKRHVAELADLTDAEARALGSMMQRVSRALIEREQAEHVYAFFFGDGVPHVHVHLMPRYPGAPREYWGTRVDEWPDAPKGASREIAAVCERLREALRVTDG